MGAERFVEGDGGGVPVEDAPFHAAVAALVGEFGEMEENGFADAATAKGGFHEKVFEVESGFREKRGVVGEENGEAGGGGRGNLVGGGKGEEAFGGGFGAEKRGAEFFLGGFDLVRELFVVGEAADELKNERNVGGCGGAEVDGHVSNEAGYRVGLNCRLVAVVGSGGRVSVVVGSSGVLE